MNTETNLHIDKIIMGTHARHEIVILLTTATLLELYHALECPIVSQRHSPVQLDTTTSFMELHLHGFLLLLEYLEGGKEIINSRVPKCQT